VADFYSRIRFFNVRNPKTPAGSQGVATLAYTSHTNGLYLRLAPAGPPRLAVLTELPSSNDLAEQGHDGVHFNKATVNVHDYGTNTGGRVAQLRQGSVRPFDFSADGKLLAVRGSRGRIEVVMTNGGKGVAVVRGHTDEVVDARFTSDGTGLVSISKDGTLRVTSTTTWQGTAKLEMPEWRNPVFLAVPATSSNIVMTAWGRRMYLWNPETGALDKWRLDGEGDEAATEGWPLAASPDLRFLCCRTDQGADVREVASGRVLCRLGFGAGFATAAAWSADSKMLALGRIVGGNFGQGQGRIDFWEVIE
jgi:WD40 repeat protein